MLMTLKATSKNNPRKNVDPWQTFSTRQAAAWAWMREHVRFADKTLKINVAYVKRLRDENQLH